MSPNWWKDSAESHSSLRSESLSRTDTSYPFVILPNSPAIHYPFPITIRSPRGEKSCE